jgi:hypothetical protein
MTDGDRLPAKRQWKMPFAAYVVLAIIAFLAAGALIVFVSIGLAIAFIAGIAILIAAVAVFAIRGISRR